MNRREFITGALGAGAACALLGCGRRGSGRLALTYNTYWTGLDAHTKAMDWVYAEYRRKYPHIDLQVTQVAGGAQDNGQKLMAELSAGGGPDILHDTGWDQVGGGYLLDLTEHISSWKDRFYKEALDNCAWNGKIYNLPTEFSYVPCLWNMRVLDSVGKGVPSTWEEYIDLGHALKAKHIPLTSLYVYGIFVFNAIVFGHQGASDLIRGKHWRSEPLLEAMKAMEHMIRAGFVPSNDMELQFPNAISQFRDGQLAHYIGGAWTLANDITMVGVDPKLRDDVAFAPIPAYNGHRPMQAWIATKSGLNQNLRNHPDKLNAALDFYKIFTSPKSAVNFVSLAHSPQGVKVNVTEEMAGPLLYRFIKSHEQATNIFVPPNNPPTFEKNGWTAIADAVACMLEGGSAEKALDVYATDLEM